MQPFRFHAALIITLFFSGATAAWPQSMSPTKQAPFTYMNQYDEAAEATFAAREADWRIGPIVYQVIVDRFAPTEDLEAKRHLYPAPKKLRGWDEQPTSGTYLNEVEVWSHEIDFWGGDLDSLRSRLDYLEGLGIDVLYLNPIQQAYTNHKYDAQDYFKVSPEYGTREDVIELAEACHDGGMKLLLDGVFNHMGRTSPMFQEALASPESEWRDWFVIGPQYEMGYRGWYNVANLPELNHENPEVRARLWGDADSVIQGYLRDGVDGWRLDVAFDIGFKYLKELTDGAHEARPGSLVIGEIWNYPEEWMPALDGTMNFPVRQLILDYVRGEISGGLLGQHLDTMITDAGVENIMRSWLVLDNHDVPRLKTEIPNEAKRRLAQVLQFTLPGAPNIYYGSEAGMTGGGDPEMRGPMDWEKAVAGEPEFDWMNKLIQLRKNNRALRIGDWRVSPSEKLLAFMRKTNRAEDTIFVVANNRDEEVTEVLLLRDSKIMSHAQMTDLLTDEVHTSQPGAIKLTMPPHSVKVLKTKTILDGEYTPYKRVH